ncbi:flagellin [Aquibium carbonis]|uniref:Flagellin n=1 Tax=Aquibium carbonis TaxID=2495581 RepID=A0A3S0A8L6_9HYPH|nr:flagellin [Aquibium carbonis]RST87152.1 flagellin [Aquibium carbonis]
MSSILTNAAAMTALKSLQATNKSLEMTQARISTGYRVGQASDNAAYWSIATTMRSDNKALLTVQDALGLGAAKIDIAYTGVSETIKVVDEIKAKLVAAREPGVDRSKIQAEISALQGQLLGNASTSSFAGENWLAVDSDSTDYNSSKSMVASFTRASDGTVSVSTITLSTESIKLFDAAVDVPPAGVGDVETGVGILDAAYDEDTGQRITNTSVSTFSVSTLDIAALTNNAADLDILDNYIAGVDDAISRMTIAASDLGAAKKRVDLQVDFVSNLMDAIDRGVGSLVDANMNEESTRLQALQVQQQLGIQGLSIANASVQGILSLFQG